VVDDAPQYRAAKAELLKSADAIIERRYASGVWLKEAWSEYTAKELNGEGGRDCHAVSDRGW
jgi:hypothetical protein